jgi:hypothetical protein
MATFEDYFHTFTDGPSSATYSIPIVEAFAASADCCRHAHLQRVSSQALQTN